MQKISLSVLTELAKTASKKAGEKILGIYQSEEIGLTLKGDQSPLTLADQAAHDEIVIHLAQTGLPILSEEGSSVPFEIRKDWEYFWLVDPLDGTKEFVKRNGEFTVNIALIHQGTPVIGVVYAPVLDWLYWGNSEIGAWKQVGLEESQKLNEVTDATVKTIVASRSHMNPETADFIAKYPQAEVISIGSSIKFMLVAENKAQLYPRFGPTMEWDTAAAHAVVMAMGGKVLAMKGQASLTYNKPNLLNPDFLVQGFGS
ncbi:3'(2'),5'-bisphosphate nucleotidase CysQ [Cognataquiflexum rubidum]|uniref:3'(2'),5'-bisphosphate nucleotidase CysQ n=1 Tax=Cognataquiflexum rubidum TaxID=2922273 RepID=UPI001F142BE9|nr:3'(2'),5'-bisphosphate nucleotidase CysQ [Cognataquiflexum rubidum]MCH6235763.1 3'(2'),5'-bisphosphate nucleotidase CysQ [Cognataquiflexum rubidum]